MAKNVLSEPFLGELSGKLAQIHMERTTAAPSELVIEMKEQAEKNPHDPENWVKLGRAYRRQQMHREAIAAYSRGLFYEPFYGLFYRHRAHAYLNTSRWEEAIADWTMATRLIPENWDVWYHLGATCFIAGDYETAAKAYVRTLELTENLQQLVAVSDWYWMTLKRLGKDAEAEALLDKIPDEISEEDEKGGGKEYHKRLMLYKGKFTPEEFEKDMGGQDIAIITAGYGLANYYYVNGDEANGNRIVELILKEGEARYWSAFGYQASLGEKIKRGKK